MARAVIVLIILFVASPLMELHAGQECGLLDRSALPVVTTDSPKQCCRVCRKGKACGNGCISQERQCTKTTGCACNASQAS